MRHRCLASETCALKAPVRGSAKGEDKDRPVSYLTSQEYPSRRGGPGVCRGHSGEAAFWCADDTACAGAGAPTHHSRGSRNTTHDDITPGTPWRRKRRDRIADAPALTSQPQRAGFPLTPELGPTQLPKPSWIKISQIRTRSVERIGRKLGTVSPEEVARVIEGLNEICLLYTSPSPRD